MPTPMVIDVSHYQTIRDWNAVRAAGIVGVIHKCTEGSNYTDTTYSSHRVAARQAGLLWGAYHFLRPGNMAQQAAYFAQEASIDDATLVAADHEDAGVSLSSLKAFLDELQQLTGRTGAIYSGHLLKEQLGKVADPFLAQHRLWLAHYTTGVPTWPTATFPMWWIWQYTDKGTIAGIDGNVDLNAFAGSADDLAREWSGVTQPEPESVPRQVSIDIAMSEGVELSLSLNGKPISIG